jgi:hypothetical protein
MEASRALARDLGPLFATILIIAFVIRICKTIKNKFSANRTIDNKILHPLNDEPVEGIMLFLLGCGGYWIGWLILGLWWLTYKARMKWRQKNNAKSED